MFVDRVLAPGEHPPMRWSWSFLTALFLVLGPLPFARGQTSAPSTDHPIRDRLSVYLCTYGPGAEPWEKFGHDGIAITDNQTGDSVTYNWGVFNFGSGLSGLFDFGRHFILGKLVYSMASAYTDDMVGLYRSQHRLVLFQELRLPLRDKINLLHRLEANDTDANRYYLYDYFRKNCTTMARDALDQTVHGRIAQTLSDLPTGTTYRWHDRRATADTLWLYVFLDFILGHGVDRPLSAWDESFLPEKLAEHLRRVQVPGQDGKLMPLVISEQMLSLQASPERTEPPDYFRGFLTTGVVLAAVLVVLAVLGGRFPFFRLVFGIGVMLWSLPVGVLGGLATFAYFTNHDAAKWNENWFQGNPLSLLLLVLMPLSRWWPTPAKWVAMAIFALSVLGLLAKVTPWFWQTNAQIIAAMLPVHAAIAFGIARTAIRQRKPAAPATHDVPTHNRAVA